MLNFYYSAPRWNVIAVMMADFWNFWFFAEFFVFRGIFGFARNFWDFTKFFGFCRNFGFSRNYWVFVELLTSSPKLLLLSRLETSEKRSILWADFFFVEFLSRTSPKYLERKTQNLGHWLQKCSDLRWNGRYIQMYQTKSVIYTHAQTNTLKFQVELYFCFHLIFYPISS